MKKTLLMIWILALMVTLAAPLPTSADIFSDAGNAIKGAAEDAYNATKNAVEAASRKLAADVKKAAEEAADALKKAEEAVANAATQFAKKTAQRAVQVKQASVIAFNKTTDALKTAANTVADTGKKATAVVRSVVFKEKNSKINPPIDTTPDQAPPEYRPSLDKDLITMLGDLKFNYELCAFDGVAIHFFQVMLAATTDPYSADAITAHTTLNDPDFGLLMDQKKCLKDLAESYTKVYQHFLTKSQLKDITVKQDGKDVVVVARTVYMDYINKALADFHGEAVKMINDKDQGVGLWGVTLPIKAEDVDEFAHVMGSLNTAFFPLK